MYGQCFTSLTLLNMILTATLWGGSQACRTEGLKGFDYFANELGFTSQASDLKLLVCPSVAWRLLGNALRPEEGNPSSKVLPLLKS